MPCPTRSTSRARARRLPASGRRAPHLEAGPVREPRHRPGGAVRRAHVPLGNSKSTLPDLTLRGRYEAEWGHLQASGVLRRLGWQDGGIDSGRDRPRRECGGQLQTFGEDYPGRRRHLGQGHRRSSRISRVWGSTLPSTRMATSSPSRSMAAMRPTRTSGRRSCARRRRRIPRDEEPVVPGADGVLEQPVLPLNFIWNPAGSLNVGAELLDGRSKPSTATAPTTPGSSSASSTTWCTATDRPGIR